MSRVENTSARGPDLLTVTPIKRRNFTIPGWAYGWISVAVLFAFFESVTRTGVISPSSFPPPSLMLVSLGHELGTLAFWTAVGQTVQGWGYGLLIATAIGVPAGMAVGASGLAYQAFRLPIEFLRPIPSVALIPLAILVFGISLTSKLFLVVFAAFWPIFIQSLYGVRDVDRIAMDSARCLGLPWRSRIRHVLLPSTLPYLATGLRISSAVALILSVTAELVIGVPGLGQQISVAREGGDVRLMYALIIATGALGWALNIVFATGERRVLHWHPSQRRGAGR